MINFVGFIIVCHIDIFFRTRCLACANHHILRQQHWHALQCKKSYFIIKNERILIIERVLQLNLVGANLFL